MANTNTLNFHIENIATILCVKDMKRSLSFYIDILGFNNAEWGNDDFTSIFREGAGFYLCRNGQGQPGMWVWVGFDGDIFEMHRQLLSKGVKIKLPPTNFSYAYEMQVEDPDGHVLRFGTEPDINQPFADR